jgi:hypothetical protein
MFKEAIKRAIRIGVGNVMEDPTMYDGLDALLEAESMEYYKDVPVVITDKDGNEYWITVQKKRN